MSQEAQTCTEEPCPVHGAWAAWNTWGSCSATCGIGLQRRDRSCSTPYPGPNGNHCFGDSRDDQICLANTYHDGDWSSWQAWGTCSRTCGDGIRSRSRSCDNPLPSIQGKYCQGEPYQVETCNMQSCPVTNGGWGSWTSWTSCTASCNGGMQSRQRICNNPKPSADGDFCDGNAMNVRMCNQQHCPITNGGWGSWTSWTSCSVSCNGGMQSRQRHCNNPKPSFGGNFCDGIASDVRMCYQQHCPR
ncbi:thrombospondin-1-like isoform X2 [Mercenaria mercenaria]|nr:thrombospondin-1-like isoform X2 [Mercenaria mercenaria]